MNRFITASLYFGLAFSVFGQDELEPTDFHTFTDKKGQEIEARALSVSDDMRSVRIERRDRRVFEFEIVLLSLDDQMFIKDWLTPPDAIIAGGIKAFGVMPNGSPVDITAADGISDFVELSAMKSGWVGRRKNGAIVSFSSRYNGMKNVRQISSNTVWCSITKDNGSVWTSTTSQQREADLGPVHSSAAGNRHYGALTLNKTVKVWGNDYKNDNALIAPPGDPLKDIIKIASTQNCMAAVDEAGTVFSWHSGKADQFSDMPGDGVVDIQGNIFEVLMLTRSGEVYQFRAPDVTKSRIPSQLADEKGPFLKIRCNGSSFAVQREDKTWFAWGTNGAGVIDHINGLGPVEDLAFFTEPNKDDHGYVVWLTTAHDNEPAFPVN